MAGLGSLGYLFMVWKGWRLSDFLYVTRGSLNETLGGVTSGTRLLGFRLGCWAAGPGQDSDGLLLAPWQAAQACGLHSQTA